MPNLGHKQTVATVRLQEAVLMHQLGGERQISVLVARVVCVFSSVTLDVLI